MLLSAMSAVGEAGIRWLLYPVPASNVGFEEQTEAIILPPPGGPWELRIDDETITLDAGVWRWQPGFYAGEVTAQLLTGDGRLAAEYLLDVAPDSEKLGRARFEDMLKEVLAEDPFLAVGDEPATLLSGNEARFDDPLSALLGFSRVRVYGPRFVHALHEAARHPRMTLRRRRGVEPPHRVRRVDGGSLRTLTRSAAWAASIGGDSSEEFRPREPVHIDVPIAELHVDGAANRSVVALMHSVRRRIRTLHGLLQRLRPDEESATRTPLSARMPARLAVLERLDAELGRLLRNEPWQQVTRPEITAAGLIALAADPSYARVYQMAWRALRMGAGGDSAEDRLWLSPTWELFERWCFVRIGALLREFLPGLNWQRWGPGKHPSGADVTWAGMGPSLSLHLLLQPVFRSWDQPACWGFQSISRERCPDIVITFETKEERGFIVLDAKYRRGRRAILEEMAVAHIYRDSLRWHSSRPQFALLLLPADSAATWLSEDAFQRTERVGVVALGNAVPALLKEALAKYVAS